MEGVHLWLHKDLGLDVGPAAHQPGEAGKAPSFYVPSLQQASCTGVAVLWAISSFPRPWGMYSSLPLSRRKPRLSKGVHHDHGLTGGTWQRPVCLTPKPFPPRHITSHQTSLFLLINARGIRPNPPFHSACAMNRETRPLPGVSRTRACSLPPEWALIMHAICTHDAGGVSDGKPLNMCQYLNPSN